MKKKSEKEKCHANLIAALANIKSLLKQLGNGLLSPEVEEWLTEFDGKDGKKIKKVKKAEQDAIGVKIILKNGKVFRNKKVTALVCAIEVDNLLIVVHKGQKGDGQGNTFFPKKEGDRVVILLDEADVGDEIRMKMVLFHELVHVKQIRDKNSGFKKIRDEKKVKKEGKKEKKVKKSDKEITDEIKKKLTDNFEAEAHLATLFFAALLIQAHPESSNAILEKYKTALKKFKDHKDKAQDRTKLIGQILDTVGKLVEDIKGENAKLKRLIDAMGSLGKNLAKEIQRYGKSLPNTEAAKKVKGRLEKLKKSIEKAKKAVDNFEKLKKDLIGKEKELRKQLKDILERTEDLRKKKEAFEKETDKEKRAELKKELKKMRKALKKARKKAKEALGKLTAALGKAGTAAQRAMSEIKETIKELRKEQDRNEDEKLLDIISKIISTYRKASNRLKKLKFKLNLLRELEKALGDFL